MEGEQTTPISARVPLTLLAEIHKELKETGKNMNEFINEAVRDKLYNESNVELINKEIEYHQEIVKNLEGKKKQHIEKEKVFDKIPEKEISFLLETKELLEREPTFVHGRINLYKNKFGKHFKISPNDFFKLLNKAEEQHNRYTE